MKTTAAILATLLGGASAAEKPTTTDDSQHFEVGSFDKISHVAKTIQFAARFENAPVVFAGSVTAKGGAPVATRIAGVSKYGVSTMKLVEPSCNGKHNAKTLEHANEELDWAAIPVGVYRTGERGQKMIVGRSTITPKAKGRTTITFPEQFKGDDVAVVLSIQSTVTSSKWKVARVDSTDNEKFTMIIQADEQAEKKGDLKETVEVGWMAMGEGLHKHNGYTFHARKIQSESGNRVRSVALNSMVGDDKPLIFATIGSENDEEPAFVRVIKEEQDLEAGHFKVFVDEDHCKDNERRHATEDIFLVTMNKNQDFHVEMGTEVAVAHAPMKEIAWNSFGSDTPVVFMNIVTENGADAVTTKMSQVSSTGAYNVRVHEPECARYGTGAHVAENIDWSAFRAGSFGETTKYGGIKIGRVTKGKLGTTQNALGYVNYKFKTPFPEGVEVAVVVTIQGDANPNAWKVVRTTKVDRHGFTAWIQSATGINKVEGATEVGFIAAPMGMHNVDGHEFHVQKVTLPQMTTGNLKETVKIVDNVLEENKPMVYASIATAAGGDPTYVRVIAGPKTGDRVQSHSIFLGEDGCDNGKDKFHMSEQVYVITASRSGNAKGQGYISSAADFKWWSQGTSKPSMISSMCNPMDCPQWSCHDYCACFAEESVRSVFSDPAYEASLLKICPEDSEPCDCTRNALRRLAKE